MCIHAADFYSVFSRCIIFQATENNYFCKVYVAARHLATFLTNKKTNALK